MTPVVERIGKRYVLYPDEPNPDTKVVVSPGWKIIVGPNGVHRGGSELMVHSGKRLNALRRCGAVLVAATT